MARFSPRPAEQRERVPWLLYVAVTRARHQAAFAHVGLQSPLLGSLREAQAEPRGRARCGRLQQPRLFAAARGFGTMLAMTTESSRLLRVHDALGTPLLNIAHRGARGVAPENTLAAFEKAAQLGAHMFELDVHLSADGHVIVHHDDDLLRCTDAAQRFPGRASYYVSDFSLRELRSLDAGSWFLTTPGAHALSESERERYASGTLRLPALHEVLALAGSLGRAVNIELKTLPRLYPQLTAAVLACLRHFGMPERVLISSFDHVQLLQVRAGCERLATAALCSGRLARCAQYLQLLDADAYHPSCSAECDSLGFQAVDGRLDTATIAALRAAGKHINVWTCNDPSQMQRLIAAGVTGIITDYPDRLTQLTAAMVAPRV